jgi:hypothetical protein
MMTNLVESLSSKRIFLVSLAPLEFLHWRLADRHVLLSYYHTMEELALLLGDDQCLG